MLHVTVQYLSPWSIAFLVWNVTGCKAEAVSSVFCPLCAEHQRLHQAAGHNGDVTVRISRSGKGRQSEGYSEQSQRTSGLPPEWEIHQHPSSDLCAILQVAQVRILRGWGCTYMIRCLFVNVPQLKPWGSAGTGWEGSVCNHFPTCVCAVVHTSAVLTTTPAAALELQAFQ